MNEQVLSVLSPAPPSYVLNSDLNLQKLGLEALALGRLERDEESQDKLASALNKCNSSNCPVVAELLAIKGLLDVDKGNYVSAKTSFEKVLELSRERKDAFLEARALLQLGYVTDKQDFFEESIEWSTQAAARAHEIGAKLVQSLAEGNLGWALYRTGDHEESLQLFLRAEKQAEESASIDNQVKWLNGAGFVYVNQRQFEIAANSYRKALDLATKINSKEDILDAQISLAFLRVQTGEFDLAEQYSDQVIRSARDNGNRVDELYGLAAKGEVAARRGNTKSAEAIFSEVVGDTNGLISLKWDAEDKLANLYAAQHQPVKAEAKYKAALATFESARSLIHQEDVKLPFLENGSGLYDDYIGLLLAEGRSAEALAVADHNRARTLIEGLGQLRQGSPVLPPGLDAQRIAGLARAVVLYYWLGEKESFLWAITENQTKLFHLPRAAEIDAAVTRYRRALEGPEDVVHQFNSDGVELYRTLVQPAERMFKKHTKIVVLPDGSLNGLNFETLVVPGPEPHFWIEDVTLSRAPSLRLLEASLRKRSPAPGKLLIMGNPLSPSQEYSTPPQAALEIEDVKGHFPISDQMILDRDRATPNAYAASHPEQFSYIHFVAHGIANHATPLDSAIILSRETGDNDSFRLYARDIIRHPLRAEIVSISACYGAGSRAYSGEGLVGLAWAFLQAGARNVVAALWDVSGASSPELMNDMYAGITAGKPPDEALRQAKLSLLHSGTAFRKPFYWAPFLLYTGS